MGVHDAGPYTTRQAMGELQGFRGLNERLVIDTSEKDPVYLLIGKNGSHIRLSASAHQLLRSISSGISFEAMAEILSRQQDRSISPTEVETAYKYVVGQIAEIERTTNRNPPGFWLRIRC